MVPRNHSDKSRDTRISVDLQLRVICEVLASHQMNMLRKKSREDRHGCFQYAQSPKECCLAGLLSA